MLPVFRDMIIPPGNPRDHFRGMEGLMQQYRSGGYVKTIGSTTDTLGTLVSRKHRKKGGRKNKC
jgi:hypothetical protein